MTTIVHMICSKSRLVFIVAIIVAGCTPPADNVGDFGDSGDLGGADGAGSEQLVDNELVLSVASSREGEVLKTVVSDGNGKVQFDLEVGVDRVRFLRHRDNTEGELEFPEPLGELPSEAAADALGRFIAAQDYEASLAERGRIIDNPGCDWVPNDPACMVKCCAAHDECYYNNDCSALSWITGPLDFDCYACNVRVVLCILSRCPHSEGDPDEIACFDATCGAGYACPSLDCDVCASPCNSDDSTCEGSDNVRHISSTANWDLGVGSFEAGQDLLGDKAFVEGELFDVAELFSDEFACADDPSYSTMGRLEFVGLNTNPCSGLIAINYERQLAALPFSGLGATGGVDYCRAPQRSLVLNIFYEVELFPWQTLHLNSSYIHDSDSKAMQDQFSIAVSEFSTRYTNGQTSACTFGPGASPVSGEFCVEGSDLLEQQWSYTELGGDSVDEPIIVQITVSFTTSALPTEPSQSSNLAQWQISVR